MVSMKPLPPPHRTETKKAEADQPRVEGSGTCCTTRFSTVTTVEFSFVSVMSALPISPPGFSKPKNVKPPSLEEADVPSKLLLVSKNDTVWLFTCASPASQARKPNFSTPSDSVMSMNPRSVLSPSAKELLMPKVAYRTCPSSVVNV